MFLKLFFLCFIETTAAAALGYSIGGLETAMLGGLTGAVFFTWSLMCGHTWILQRLRGYRLEESEAPEIFSILEDLCAKLGLPLPHLYVLPNAAPNLFSAGFFSRQPVIAFNKGLAELLNREEMQGVLAHQLAVLKTGDALVRQATALFLRIPIAFIGFIRRIFSFAEQHRDPRKTSNAVITLLTCTLMPAAAFVLRILVSKKGLFQTEQYAAKWSGNPLHLAGALRKIQNAAGRLPNVEGDLELNHLWMLGHLDTSKFPGRFFEIHPSVLERLQRLHGESCA